MRFLRRIHGLLIGGCAAWALGCGVSQDLYNARTTELDRCRSELNRTRSQVTTAQNKADELNGETVSLRDRLKTLEMERFKLANNLQATQKEMDELRRAHAQAEQRGELYRMLVSKLRQMIDSRTLAVDIRKGRMVVKVGDQILFDPGKAELKPAGEDTLRQLAAVLRDIPDRDFLVAGHTDNKPIKQSPYRSNWELSTARAVTVVRFLQQEGVDPRHLAAAGFSEFDPISDNGDPETRALNRRIEVVVMPNLEELPSIDPSLANVQPPTTPLPGEAPEPAPQASPQPAATTPPPR